VNAVDYVKAKGLPVVVSVSGGKDSTATALHLRDLGIPYRMVHLAVGWEHPDTDRYVREVLPKYLGPIEIAENLPPLDPEDEAIAVDLEARYLEGRPSAMVRWTLHKAMFSSRLQKWCTEYTKIMPFHAWARENMPWPDFVSAVGVRAEESNARAALPELDLDDEGYSVWRPLIAWTEEQVIDLHLRHGVPPNPLYTRGASRVGCWPCIFARKAEIRQVAEMSPERIALIADLEGLITSRVIGRRLLKGASIEHADGSRVFRAYFSNPTYKTDLARNLKKAQAAGSADPAQDARDRTSAQSRIEDVVAWSRTNRKGEPEPFARLPHEAGCTRWGLCDSTWIKGDPE
jgi:3'-phosphoadenosine 5'-phosphosulfate sulfotransferase (PAPS reductase)/FAD synthetase